MDPISAWRLGPGQETQEEFNDRLDRAVSALMKGVGTMSWSNSWIGKPAAIKAAMARYEETLTEPSKSEFAAARPALETLLDQNSSKEREPVVQLDGNGHAYTLDGERQYSTCSVTLKTLGALVE